MCVGGTTPCSDLVPLRGSHRHVKYKCATSWALSKPRVLCSFLLFLTSRSSERQAGHSDTCLHVFRMP